jgi:hypothetical protein
LIRLDYALVGEDRLLILHDGSLVREDRFLIFDDCRLVGQDCFLIRQNFGVRHISSLSLDFFGNSLSLGGRPGRRVSLAELSSARTGPFDFTQGRLRPVPTLPVVEF